MHIYFVNNLCVPKLPYYLLLYVILTLQRVPPLRHERRATSTGQEGNYEHSISLVKASPGPSHASLSSPAPPRKGTMWQPIWPSCSYTRAMPVLPIWKQFEGLTHCHGGRFKGITSTSHMLYVVLKSPHGLKTSLATASLKFLVSFANCGNLLLKCIHAFPFTGWLIWTSTGACLILCHWISSPILLETNIFSSTMGSTGNASKPSENHICSHSYLLIWIHCILDRHPFWHNSS